MIAAVSFRDINVSITTPTGWSRISLAAQPSAGNNGMQLATYLKVAGASEPASYSWFFSGGFFEYAVGGIVSFSGVDNSNPLETGSVWTVGDGSTYNFSTPTITPTSNGALVLSIFSVTNADTWTPPTSFTEAVDIMSPSVPDQVGTSLEMAYRIQATAGSISATATMNNTFPSDWGVALILALKPSLISLDHYELSVPSSSISCLATGVTVTACADTSSPCTNKFTGVSGKTATLSTGAGSLSATTVTFDATGVATSSLNYASAVDGATAAVTLSGEQTAATNPRKCCTGASCTVANSCTTTFNTTGFIFTNANGGAATNIGTQISGTTSSGQVLRAVKTNTSTQACEAALTNPTSVNFAYECNNPTTCSANNLMTVTGASTATIQRYNSAAVGVGTAVNLAFDANGNAPFTLNFLDVGHVTLYATKAASGTLLASLAGNSNGFVVRPAQFVLSAVKQAGGSQIANPGATSNLDPKLFVRAGEAFGLTVTSVTSGGAATPNFGKENAPAEYVSLTPTVVLPSPLPTGGSVGVVSNASIGSAFGSSFVNGAATVNNLSWSEVGILSLAPALGDGQYIGTSNVTGASTGNIGRFYPDHFDTVVTQGCVSGAFTYSGQNMTVQVTAKNLAGATTLNYDGTGSATANFAKTITLSNSTASPAAGAFLPTTVAGSSFVAGVGSGSTKFTFSTVPTVPSVVKVRATDSDGASSSTGTTEGVANVRSGRLAIQNVYGSELLALPMLTTTQYWTGSAYVTNTIDSCTTLTVPSATTGLVSTPAGLKNLVAPTMNAGAVSAGNVATIVAGDARLQFAAPGAGNSGYLDVTVVAPTWLQFPWPSASAPNPTGRATFGVFKSPLIYRRENY